MAQEDGVCETMTWDGTERRHMPCQCQSEVLEQLQAMRITQESNAKLLAQVVEFITGNGKPEHGAIVRMDRLEQAEATRKQHANWMWTAISGLSLKTLWDVVMHRR